MAKELPYFKFEPNQWDNGNIQMCSRELKGLFIDLCALYWSRLGELPYALALQRHCNGQDNALNELKNIDVIAVVDDQIIIEFLDEQLDEFHKTSEKRRDAANKRWSDASALQVHCKSNAIREEKKREEKKREEKKREEKKREEKKREENIIDSVYPFDLFWNDYEKKGNRKTSEERFSKLNEEKRSLIKKVLPAYIKSTPEKKFRKNAEVYISKEAWNDEIINEISPAKQGRSSNMRNSNGSKTFQDTL